jgi:photosystem II stability/assembly factor-like uncharacterized protein
MFDLNAGGSDQAMTSILRSCWRMSLLSLPVFLLASIEASLSPASAQAPADVMSRLQSLPPQAQRNALRRYLYFYQQRAFPNQQIPPGAIQRARAEHEQKFGALRPQQPPGISPQFNQNIWTAIGPNNLNAGQASGRLNSIAIDPTNTNIIYAAGATGGVWKTTNGGTSWTPLTDTQCSTAMGSIAIDPTNTQVIYAGTGEANFSLDSYYGCGVLKSTDGGATWAQIGASIFDTATGGATISKVVINPTSTQTVLVASSFGLYRSTNGGANFTQVMSQTPVTDLVVDPTNTLIWYAAVGNIFGSANNGVYKSTDGGASFPTKLAGGLPTVNVGRINIAIAASSPTTLYASVQNSSSFALLGIWQTTNGGTNWTQLTATGASCATQCWYDMYLAVDPTNAAIVYFGGFSLYRSANGGASFTDIGGSIHVDHHSFAFLPGGPTSTIFAGSDGGIFKSTNSGTNWTSLNTNIAITQFYSGIALHPTAAGTVLGGTQDNGSPLTTGSLTWTDQIGGDGGFAAIDFTTPTTAYGETQWTPPGCGFCGPRRSDNLGVSAFNLRTTGINLNDPGLFIPPLIMSPSTATTLYFGTNKVHITTNRGDNWTASGTTLGGNVTHIAQAPSNAAIIYAGATNGLVYKSTNTNATYASFSTGLPARVPTYLAVHPTDPNTAFVAVSGFGSGHVWKTINGGTSWTNISGNLPDVPVNAIVLDPTAPTTEIFVGTDLGVYRTHDGGTTWTVFNTGLPNVPVLDLKYNPTTGVLAAATHGRGVFIATIGALTATHDFNGDSKSDIAWRDSSGNAALWLMNGGSVSSSGVIGNVPAAWSIVGQRDFNGDGKHDLLWRDTSGNTAIWFLNGLQVSSSSSIGNVPTTWTVVGTADFNGDGKGDILWRDSSGTTAIWLMNGAQVATSASIGTVPTNWSIVGAADFDGDSKADILWRDSSGNTAIWFINGTQVTSSGGIGTVPIAWTIVATGDFDGNGKADILWRDSSGNTAIWLMNGTAVSSSASIGVVPTTWSVKETGDFDGNGKADILWRDSSGNTAIWFMNGTAVASTASLGIIPTSWTIQGLNAD